MPESKKLSWRILGVPLLVIVVAMFSAPIGMVGKAAATPQLKFYHDNPEWQNHWEAIGKASAESIGIDLNPIPFKTEVYKTRVKVDLPTQRAPAIFKWWFGYRAKELIDAGLVADLSDVWDKVEDTITPGLRKQLTMSGITYALPLNVGYWVWYYNKPLLEKYDLKPPKTWDDFLEQCRFFKEKGISCIGNTIGKSRWTSFIMFQELLYRIDADFYTKLMEGKAHWTDRKVVQAMKIWKRMLENGFFAPMDKTYVEDFPRMFKQGKLAYAPFGDWYSSILTDAGLKSGKDFGITILPPITQKGKGAIAIEVSPLMVGKNSPQKELAKKWFEWYGGSPQAAQLRWQEFHLPPWSKHISTETIAKEAPALAHEKKLLKNYPKKLIRFWEATPVEIVEYAVSQFETMMTHPKTYKKILKNIERKAAEVWPDYGVKYKPQLSF